MSSNARITRFDLSDGNSKTATRESLAAEVSRMILDGTVENLTLENLNVLPLTLSRSVNIAIDPDDRDPLGTARFILEEAGISTSQTDPDEVSPEDIPEEMSEFLREAGFFVESGNDSKPVVNIHDDGSSSICIFRNDPFPPEAIEQLAKAAGFKVVIE